MVWAQLGHTRIFSIVERPDDGKLRARPRHPACQGHRVNGDLFRFNVCEREQLVEELPVGVSVGDDVVNGRVEVDFECVLVPLTLSIKWNDGADQGIRVRRVCRDEAQSDQSPFVGDLILANVRWHSAPRLNDPWNKLHRTLQTWQIRAGNQARRPRTVPR